VISISSGTTRKEGVLISSERGKKKFGGRGDPSSCVPRRGREERGGGPGVLSGYPREEKQRGAAGNPLLKEKGERGVSVLSRGGRGGKKNAGKKKHLRKRRKLFPPLPGKEKKIKRGKGWTSALFPYRREGRRREGDPTIYSPPGRKRG